MPGGKRLGALFSGSFKISVELDVQNTQKIDFILMLAIRLKILLLN